MGRIARLAAAGPRVGSTTLSPGRSPPLGRLLPVPGGTHRPAGRCRSLNGWHRSASRCRSPGGIHRSVPGWDPPPCLPGGLHRSAGRCRSLGGPHRPAGRCRSPDGPHRPLVAAGPRLDYTARFPGWAAPPAGRCRSPVGLYRSTDIPLYRATPDGPHRPAGRYRSPDGPHRPQVAAGPRLGSTAQSPVCFAPPGWPLLVPSIPRVGSTTRLAAAFPRVGWHAHPV